MSENKDGIVFQDYEAFRAGTQLDKAPLITQMEAMKGFFAGFAAAASLFTRIMDSPLPSEITGQILVNTCDMVREDLNRFSALQRDLAKEMGLEIVRLAPGLSTPVPTEKDKT